MRLLGKEKRMDSEWWNEEAGTKEKGCLCMPLMKQVRISKNNSIYQEESKFSSGKENIG